MWVLVVGSPAPSSKFASPLELQRLYASHIVHTISEASPGRPKVGYRGRSAGLAWFTGVRWEQWTLGRCVGSSWLNGFHHHLVWPITLSLSTDALFVLWGMRWVLSVRYYVPNAKCCVLGARR